LGGIGEVLANSIVVKKQYVKQKAPAMFRAATPSCAPLEAPLLALTQHVYTYSRCAIATLLPARRRAASTTPAHQCRFVYLQMYALLLEAASGVCFSAIVGQLA